MDNCVRWEEGERGLAERERERERERENIEMVDGIEKG